MDLSGNMFKDNWHKRKLHIYVCRMCGEEIDYGYICGKCKYKLNKDKNRDKVNQYQRDWYQKHKK